MPVPSFLKPHLSFAPVNVKFPQPRFVPTGSIQATPRTISGGIEGGIAKALSVLGVNERKSAQFAQRAMAPLTDATPVGNAIGAEEGVGLLSRGISKGDATTGALGLGSLLLSILPYGQKAKKPLKSLLADTSGAIRAWHATTRNFDHFDPSLAGTANTVGHRENATFFTDSPETANSYLGGMYVKQYAPGWDANREFEATKRLFALEKEAKKLPPFPVEWRKRPDMPPHAAEAFRGWDDTVAAAKAEHASLEQELMSAYQPVMAFPEGANIRPVEIDDGNLLTIDANGAQYSPDIMESALRQAKRKKKDGVALQNFFDWGGASGTRSVPQTTFAIFDPTATVRPSF